MGRLVILSTATKTAEFFLVAGSSKKSILSSFQFFVGRQNGLSFTGGFVLRDLSC